LSFSEVGYQKEVVVLSVENNTINEISSHTIPKFREIYKVEGTVASCISQFHSLISNPYQLTPWVEIILDEAHNINTDDLKKSAEDYPFEILKTTLKRQKQTKGIEELMAEAKSIKELVPTEVFKLKCQEIGYDLEDNPEVWDAFNEVLQGVKEQ
jgi:exonuclease SbcD